MELIAVRHGQTDYNKEHRIMGQEIAAPLNESGIEQVQSLVPQLQKHAFDMLYASPLLRTKQTADIINEELQLPMTLRDELKERSVGNLAGKMYDEVLEIIAPAHYDKNYDFRPYGGESFEEVRDRVSTFLKELEQKHAGQKILVVTHAGIIEILYTLFEKEREQDVRNVCVHSF